MNQVDDEPNGDEQNEVSLATNLASQDGQTVLTTDSMMPQMSVPSHANVEHGILDQAAQQPKC